jgi:hypothetical protein
MRSDPKSILLKPETWLYWAIAIVAVLQLHLIFVQAINWDEFFYLSRIYELRRGTLEAPLQTIHARLFSWLPLVAETEIGQIRVARIVMLGCEMVTVMCIIAIAEKFTNRPAALIAGLAYIGGGFAFYHGFSFRADPIAAALLMSALLLLIKSRLCWRSMAVIALLVALAGMVTVKSGFYAPALLGIGFLRLSESAEKSRIFYKLAGTALLSLIFFAAIYWLHKSGLHNGGPATATTGLSNASDKMFSMGVLPRLNYLLKQIFLSPFLSALIVAAFFVVAVSKRKRAEKAALLGLLVPVLTLLIYRNSFPYYYAFILAPTVAASTVVITAIIGRYGIAFTAAIPLLNAVILYVISPKDMQKTQQNIITATHEIFPTPVRYIDFCSMISSFPKQGFFMSGWGMENYRNRRKPRFADIMEQGPTPLLVLNHDAFGNAFANEQNSQSLLPADAKLIRENFIHHWGPLWVAGKVIPAGDAAITITIQNEGLYTVEGVPVTIDGKRHGVGGTIYLTRDEHEIGENRRAKSTLRWGDNLPKSGIVEPAAGRFGMFTGF